MEEAVTQGQTKDISRQTTYSAEQENDPQANPDTHIPTSPVEIPKLEEEKNAGDVNERGDGSGRDEHAGIEMKEEKGTDQEKDSKNEADQYTKQESMQPLASSELSQNSQSQIGVAGNERKTVNNPVDEESSSKQSEKEGDMEMGDDETKNEDIKSEEGAMQQHELNFVSPDEILNLEEATIAGDVKERGDRSGRNKHADMEMEEDKGKDQEMNSKNEADQDHKPGVQESMQLLASSELSQNSQSQIGVAGNESSDSSGKHDMKMSVDDTKNKHIKSEEGAKQQPESNFASNSANLKPREPLKRNQKMSKDEGQSIAVNQSNESKSPDEEVSPDEISNLEIGDQDHKPGLHEFKWIGVCVLLVALAFGLYQNLSVPNPPNPKQFNVVDVFNQEMEKLKTSFPSQRPELWRRSLIHLRRHLKTEWPTEPVSLILTSGHGAERTLGCLAQCLAQAFSTAKNSSVLNINGKSKASQDSDQVKMDIDSELRTAFEGQQFAAVIHRFEELPPGSTLIFYRYCDHENAAFKNVFLAFTIMLDAEAEVPSSVSLGGVEDMVYDHLKQKFVSSGKAAMFNQMDVDKLSGLWSRISHVILPVVAEEKTEQQGCGNCYQ